MNAIIRYIKRRRHINAEYRVHYNPFVWNLEIGPAVYEILGRPNESQPGR